jgi:hypothetical protein
VTGAYRAEADALDGGILDVIRRWSAPPGYRGHWEYSDPAFEFDFNKLALRVFAHQLRFNEPYARYCATLSVKADALPTNWQEIPPVPAAAFKEAALCTFDPAQAELVFKTSGTTTGSGGIHYMETAALYDASLLSGFDYGVLGDVVEPLRYLMLLASPEQQPQSSLSYMMDRVSKSLGDGAESWYVEGNSLQVGPLIEDLREARRSSTAICIAGTAFAFINLLDELQNRRLALPLPSGSRIMETGGFKGRSRVVERNDMYKLLMETFSLPTHDVISEYGMTELSSQYYDAPLVTAATAAYSGVVRQAHHDTNADNAGTGDNTSDNKRHAPRVKQAPPWLQSYAVGIDGKKLPAGVVGALVHVDLANRSSCVAVQTEDLGAAVEGGIVLIGREHGAELRGCSLDAESLRVASR